MKTYNERIALRLPCEQRQNIDKLVAEGKYKNTSHLIRVALQDFLKKVSDVDAAE